MALFRAAISRSFATSTVPKLRAGAGSHATVDHGAQSASGMSTLKADFAPMYMVGGMVVLAVSIATHTAFQQLARSPTVHVNKHRRETMPEVSDPDRTISSADKFVNGSFLRKLAHVQDNKTTLNDPVRPNPFTTPRRAETLKTVGVDPALHR
ncbi:hypothetical protein HN51_007565 [Arachis hypogaea]|uniref:Uncharacterized protein n=2 Tax=Arachis TaxID=3817 RepID=A0A445D7Z1_ARAHY|nr:uncharacterized protein LOC107488516 [Arachis duranensis]XP_025697514.1 uncharacterized protein LOC112799662 [Arachis hypogaea]QHO41722.1 uncharacterized protein DS421_5g148220 [Arachis hypogaea]RYR59104.1 hypothetical protein Ahy_A05g024944 [Arachis hypogaea]